MLPTPPLAAGLKQPIHVLLTTDVVGGVWDFCWALAAELGRAGHRVTLLAFGEPSPAQRDQAAAAGAQLFAAPLKLEWMQDSTDDVRRAQSFTSGLIAELRPDVLHANQYAVAVLPAARDAGIPTVVTAHSDVLSWRRWTLHGGAAHREPLPPEWSRYAALVRKGMQTADAAVAVSDFLARELADLYGVRREVLVIYNGWPAPAVPRTAEGPRGRTTLLAGRAWDEAKNLQLAARAAEGWGTSRGRVLLLGEQRHPDTGGAVAFGPPIEVLGRVQRQDVDRYLREARLYLSPARYDPFGLLPLQAAFASCPLLLSDIPSYRELWTGAACFFRADDVDDLRRQWARLLEDDALARDLAERARRRAGERYTAARMASDYTNLYARLLRPPRRGRLVRQESYA